MRMRVNILDASLVSVRVGMGLSVVGVLMLVLDVIMVMLGMRVDVGLVVVRVLVRVRGLVSVFVCHAAPVIV